MSDLLEQLAVEDSRQHPTTHNPDVRDTTTDQPWAKYDRCPDCGIGAWGRSYGVTRRVTCRITEGWLTRASCDCGRLRWRALDLREGDFWLNHAPAVWGPIVKRPDDVAWMTGAVPPFAGDA